ncbi:hypothetical protein MPL3365_190061 [Mesorhizobium plurifarium]|uniref:Uncharacterized protein n=1 Tax=Mesorhizobium plurifarium TaxID=69974 RepID=A0A090G0V1_MESPL|nr:hypothetical protein MPL3365_190061 [Mesorhizobium plurifarium]
MLPFLSLDAMAASRGDGLHPKLARLLRTRLASAGSGVVVLRQTRNGAPIQAGPNPIGNIDGELQAGVLRFPTRQSLKARRRKN